MSKIGLVLEHMVFRVLSGLEGFLAATDVQDKKEGTDFYWYGLPVDLTLSPWKDNCEYIGSISTPCADFRLFSRTGNSRREFAQSVLVIQAVPLVPQDTCLHMVAAEIDEDFLERATEQYWVYQDWRSEMAAEG